MCPQESEKAFPFKEGKLELRLTGWAVCQINRRDEAFHVEASKQNQNHEEYR